MSLIAVVSDTHVPMRARSLPKAGWNAIAGADLILHAGDVCDPGLLDEMAEFAPVRAVMGNCDYEDVRAWGATDDLRIEVEGIVVAMIHDSGRADGRASRMRARFPDARVVVFGHSHQPLVEDVDGLMLLNPGSPTDRRRSPHHTVALLRVQDGRPSAELVRLD